jgi:hypothetical protein
MRGGSGRISMKSYLKKISDPVLKKAVGYIEEAGTILSKQLGGIKVKSPDLSIFTKDRLVLRALKDTMAMARVKVYGSFVEYLLKKRAIRTLYNKIDGKKYSLNEAELRYIKDLKKDGQTLAEIDRVVGKPGDLDFAIDDALVKKIIKKFGKKYQYIPELLQKAFKNYDFELKALKSDKSSVFSVMDTKQIDNILRKFTTDEEVAVFQWMFMQNLYDLKMPSAKIKQFDLTSGIELKGSDFAIDMHGVRKTGLTKSYFKGLIQKKNYIPLETAKLQDFKKVLYRTEADMMFLEKELERKLLNVANKVDKKLRKLGIKIDKEKFVKKYPEFLEKAEIYNAQTFDFAANSVSSSVNKRVLRAWKESIDFLSSVSVPGIVKVADLKQVVGGRIILNELLKNAKRTSKFLGDLEGAIGELTAIKNDLIYLSSGSKKALKRMLKLKVKKFMLKVHQVKNIKHIK